MSEGCEEWEYEPGVLYDDSQPGALVAELERTLPLRHRTLLLESVENCTVKILCCEEDHIHLCYNPAQVPVAMLCLYTGMAYAIAYAVDWGREVHLPVRKQAVDRALREIDLIMERFNPSYAHALKNAAPLLIAVFDGPIVSALITPVPGAKRERRLFDHNLPIAVDVTQAMNEAAMLRHAFSVPKVMGADLVTGNGIVTKDERLS